MFQGFPDVSVKSAPKANSINVGKEEEKKDGCVKSFDLPSINSVQMDASAVLRLSKFGREQPRAFGRCVGMQIGDTVEITNVIPVIQTPSHGSQMTDEDRMRKDAAAERESFEHFEKAGFDVYPVGRFASCPHNQHLIARNLYKMMEALKSGNPCLLIVFDPLRTVMGKLYLKAYVPTDEFFAMQKARHLATAETQMTEMEAILHNEVDIKGIIREVPIEITTTTLNKMFLYKLAQQPRNVKNVVLGDKHGSERYTKKTVMYLGDGVDRLRQDMVSRSYQQNDQNGPLPLRVETQLLVQQLNAQTDHIKALASTMAINADFAQKV